MAEGVVKTVKRYGNSGGVYVPRSWVGGKVRVELVEDPLNPLEDLTKKIPMEHVVSVIFYGSRARNEASFGSDVDILVVVDDDAKISVPQELKQKYDIQIKTESEVRRGAASDPIFCKTLKDEAVAAINHPFLDELKKERPRKNGIGIRLELAESSLGIVKGLMEAEGDNRNLVYPLMLRLKEIVLIQFFLENKRYSLKALEKEALSFVSRKEFALLMDIYRSVRDNKKMPKHEVTNAVSRLISMLEKKIDYVKKKAD